MNKLSKVMLVIIVMLIIVMSLIIYKYTLLKKNYNEISTVGNYTHIIVSRREYGKVNEYNTITTIFTLNKEDILINTRDIRTFEFIETAQEQYKYALEDDNFSDVKIIGNVVVHNEKIEGRVTKSKILEVYKNSECTIKEY